MSLPPSCLPCGSGLTPGSIHPFAPFVKPPPRYEFQGLDKLLAILYASGMGNGLTQYNLDSLAARLERSRQIQLQLASGISQAALAKQLGVSKQRIGQLAHPDRPQRGG